MTFSVAEGDMGLCFFMTAEGDMGLCFFMTFSVAKSMQLIEVVVIGGRGGRGKEVLLVAPCEWLSWLHCGSRTVVDVVCSGEGNSAPAPAVSQRTPAAATTEGDRQTAPGAPATPEAPRPATATANTTAATTTAITAATANGCQRTSQQPQQCWCGRQRSRDGRYPDRKSDGPSAEQLCQRRGGTVPCGWGSGFGQPDRQRYGHWQGGCRHRGQTLRPGSCCWCGQHGDHRRHSGK